MEPADRAGWVEPCLGWLVEGLGWDEPFLGGCWLGWA